MTTGQRCEHCGARLGERLRSYLSDTERERIAEARLAQLRDARDGKLRGRQATVAHLARTLGVDRKTVSNCLRWLLSGKGTT